MPPTDARPTGAPQLQKAPATWQAKLDKALGVDDPAVQEWAGLIRQLAPATRHDPFTAVLSRRLAAVSRAGVNAHGLLVAAAAHAPLPDDHTGAALWWRVSAHLSPAVIAQAHTGLLNASWTDRLVDVVGTDRAAALKQDPLWPTLVATIDPALRRGWQLPDLLAEVETGGVQVDECQALIWRISVLLDPVPDGVDEQAHPIDEPEPAWTPPADDAGIPVHDWHTWLANGTPRDAQPDAPSNEGDMTNVTDEHEAGDLDMQLRISAMSRQRPDPLQPSQAQLRRWFEQDIAWREATVTRQRLLAVNTATVEFYEAHLATGSSWVRGYLHDRFGVDLTCDPRFRAGHAPAGWTHLVDHLRRHGFTDDEALQAGVATVARTGRLIDRFRDRAVFPIARDGQILGFIGRRHPDLAEGPTAGPKYLNTAETLLFSKGAQLYGPLTPPDPLAVPVLVEGPMDAIAVTLATGGSYVGVAPLGTSFTEDQAAHLVQTFPMTRPVVATDADLAGQVAADKAYWTLQQHQVDPLAVQLPFGTDPAQILTDQGPLALAQALMTAHPLAETLIRERVDNLTPDLAVQNAVGVIAARPPHEWDDAVHDLAARTGRNVDDIRADLLPAVNTWNRDPRSAANEQLAHTGDLRDRLTSSAQQAPERRWAPLAKRLHPPLLDEPDWPALATLVDQVHRDGRDVERVLRLSVEDEPLGPLPAQDLRYRLATTLDIRLPTDFPNDPVSKHTPAQSLEPPPTADPKTCTHPSAPPGR
ncbi:MAG: toprim domain-containing protein [Actinobacteria bacterium]|nr:toprim domain-containing protein [Actinomycetota bacterium]